jgi:hypothetical protein
VWDADVGAAWESVDVGWRVEVEWRIVKMIFSIKAIPTMSLNANSLDRGLWA